MSYRYERRRSRSRTCLTWLVAIIWILLFLTLAYRFLLRDQVSRFIGERIGEQFRAEVDQPSVDDQIRQDAQQAIPTVIAGVPTGEIRISEAEANTYLAGNAASLGPIESTTVHFVPGEIQADLNAMGTSSRARMGLAVQQGRIVAVNPQLDGVLGQFISLADLVQSLERQINDQLAAQGRRATDVRIEQGELIVTIE